MKYASRIGILSVCLAIVLVCVSGRQGAVAAEQEKPNILFIFADDQCFETLHALGNTEVETPNLDRLARSGVTFTHTYNMGGWHGAICVASRTMLNTGRFLWRARNLESKLGQEVQNRRFWAQHLSTAGYETYMTGKWHVKADAAAIFDHAVHIRPGMPKQTPAGYNRPIEGKPDVWKPWDRKFGGFWEGGKHWSEVVADDAGSFLNSAAKSDKPFFMYLAFNAPHDPRQSPKEFVDKYPLENILVPKNFLPEYPFMEPMGAGKKLRDEQLAPWPRTKYAVKVHRQEYYAIVSHMDAQVGKILDALEKTGKAKNTYIFFTADHGLAVGHHGLMGKQNMYEHSMRPPMIVVGPGIPKNKRIDTRVYLQDIVPTTFDVAHLPIPDQVEFRSLLPLIRGERDTQYETIYGAYREDLQRMIIKDDFKLICYPKINKCLLFDLNTDPLEMSDLAGNPKYAARLKDLTQSLHELQKKMDDPMLAGK